MRRLTGPSGAGEEAAQAHLVEVPHHVRRRRDGFDLLLHDPEVALRDARAPQVEDDVPEAIDLHIHGGLGNNPEVRGNRQNLVHEPARLQRRRPVDALKDVLPLKEVDELIAPADRSPRLAWACSRTHEETGAQRGRQERHRST